MENEECSLKTGAFKDMWEAEYLLTSMSGKAVCLVCGAEG